MGIEAIKTDFIEQVKLIRSEEIINKLQELLRKERMQLVVTEGLEDIENEDHISLLDFQSKNKIWLKSNSEK